jgi:hypothetical protein
LEALHILVQQFLCQCAILGQDPHIIFVADLDDQLMEKLFLLACPQVLIVVGDTAVLALLLGVVSTISILSSPNKKDPGHYKNGRGFLNTSGGIF